MSETSTITSTRRAYDVLGAILTDLEGAAYNISIQHGRIVAQGRVEDGMDSAARLLGANLIESEVRDGIRWDEYATVIDGVSVRITAHEDGVSE